MDIKKIAVIVLGFSLFSCSSAQLEESFGDVVMFNDTETRFYNNISFEGMQVTANLKNPLPNTFQNTCFHSEIDQRHTMINTKTFSNSIKDAEVITSYDEANYYMDYVADTATAAVEVRNINTDQSFILGNLKLTTVDQVNCFRQLAQNLCASHTGSNCATIRFMERDIAEEYLTVREIIKTNETDAEKRKALEFVRLQTKCTDLGFEGDNNIRICVEREAEYERQLTLQKLEFAEQNDLPEEKEDLGFLAGILREVIVSYPEIKAQADKDEAIRRKAFRDGQRAEQARCSGGRC